jgi:hypothetical protein
MIKSTYGSEGEAIVICEYCRTALQVKEQGRLKCDGCGMEYVELRYWYRVPADSTAVIQKSRIE